MRPPTPYAIVALFGPCLLGAAPPGEKKGKDNAPPAMTRLVEKAPQYPDLVRRLGFKPCVTDMDFSRDGQRLVANKHHVVEVWDLANKKMIRAWENQTLTGRTLITPDGKTVIALRGIGIDSWEVATGKKLRTFYEYKCTTLSCALTDGGKTLAVGIDRTDVGVEEGIILRWDIASGKELPTLRLPEGHEIHVMAYNQQRGLLAVASRTGPKVDDTKGFIYVWDEKTGKVIHRITTPGDHHYDSLAFCPDGWLLTCSVRSTASQAEREQGIQ